MTKKREWHYETERMCEGTLKRYGLRKVCTSYYRGYKRVSDAVVIEPYKGKYGEGYKYLVNNPSSSRYCYVTYWVY